MHFLEISGKLKKLEEIPGLGLAGSVRPEQRPFKKPGQNSAALKNPGLFRYRTAASQKTRAFCFRTAIL